MANWKRSLAALRQLGPGPLSGYALYQLGLRSGYYAWVVGRALKWQNQEAVTSLRCDLFPLPDPAHLAAVLGDQGQAQLLAEAEEIVGGRVRLFGAEPVPLRLGALHPLRNWSFYERHGLHELAGEIPYGDVKFLWEPARFGWAMVLARAYRLQPDPRYVEAFWQYLDTFLSTNPPFSGLHWVSAQEVALRLIALVLAGQVFSRAPESTPERLQRLAQAIAQHAARLPATLVYAQAQNNNHLLSEAAGLYTAGLALPGHPQAERWRLLGRRWFERGLLAQVATDGGYSQYSANYHRLALHLALWVQRLSRAEGRPLSAAVLERLIAATGWLAALVDPLSGQAPNLGPNDGALLFPLAACPFQDFRPTLQAAHLAFRDAPLFSPGPWDELALWLAPSSPSGKRTAAPAPVARSSPAVLRSPDGASWAYLRAARFRSRPGHSDQLHLDLWRKGSNLALDPGAYLYNAAPPWDNSLRYAQVHNTVTVDDHDPMTDAGRFLFLDWGQAEIVARERLVGEAGERLVAQHDGYRRLGLLHRRLLTAFDDGRWLVEDELLPRRPSAPPVAHTACLHWLLPDRPYTLQPEANRVTLHLQLPDNELCRLNLHTPAEPVFQLARAGELLSGRAAVSPTWGWFSPTYGVKIPALSLRLWVRGYPPLTLRSEWSFGEG